MIFQLPNEIESFRYIHTINYVVLIVLLYKLVRCKAFLVGISLSTVLEMNFFSNRVVHVF